jgi:predicted TIM-barrel fold metal-dependent hydrolase
VQRVSTATAALCTLDPLTTLDPIHDDTAPLPCIHALALQSNSAGERPSATYMHLPRIAPEDDVEGARVPSAAATMGPLIDAHVHLFPDRVFAAMYRWFDAHAWSIRYRLRADEVVEFQRSRGVSAIVALHFAHVEGMAASLNAFVSEVQHAHRDFVWALGTVLPGEPNAREIVADALGRHGLHGIKIHCHTQRIAADDPRLDEVYAACADAGKPVVIHAGREPKSAGYGLDTHAICDVSRIERVLERFPRLKLVVPHLGADEFAAYAALLARHEGLYLDTTMMAADYFPLVPRTLWAPLIAAHAHRILYGTDFPIIPYAWDREVQRLVALPLEATARRALFSANATSLFRSC